MTGTSTSDEPVDGRLDVATAADLLRVARDARTRAYAPYSGFSVGAALMDSSGRVYPGANVENASYGLTTCAERSAVVRAANEGVRTFRAIAVVGPVANEACAPCGSCRQILHEFAPHLIVVTVDESGTAVQTALTTLLPDAFGGPGPRPVEGGR